MKKRLSVVAVVCFSVAVAAFAYSSGDVVKNSDSCGHCEHNGPSAFTCGECGRNFSRVLDVEEGDEYDIVEFSHKGHSEYETCQHSMTARFYK